MYKLLLCWRYLRTRYIALASVISVTLGVATMIVVNSVMAGFAREMEGRIHGVLSDITFEARDFGGEPDSARCMEEIRRVAGNEIAAMTPTVVVPALLNFQFGGKSIARQVDLIGIDVATQAGVSDFDQYLQHPENRRQISFDLRDGGYDTRDHQAGGNAPERRQMSDVGWPHRRRMAEARAFQLHFKQEQQQRQRALPSQAASAAAAPSGATAAAPSAPQAGPQFASASGAAKNQGPPDAATAAAAETPSPSAVTARPAGAAEAGLAASVPTSDPFAKMAAAEDPFAQTFAAKQAAFDPCREQHMGAILGIALASYRNPAGEDRFLVLPGDDVAISCPTVGNPPKVSVANFTVVDFYESKMSEYDQRFVFVPIRKLQEMRGMIDPTTQVGNFNAIQIRLKAGVDGDQVRDRLRAAFPEALFVVSTWRDKQGPLLAAVHMETSILNVLLFLIIAVAGFGILAIFFMIVVEKTRDVGILKSLGASSSGVMGIFLSYGLSLGIVGSGAGLIIGVLMVHYINQIAEVVGFVTGHKVFDPSIYYFYSIPTVVELSTVASIVGGAVAIAVAASVLPACRAAQLHPVEALRYE